MIYLAWYLGIGGVVLVMVYAAHRLGGGDALNSKSELLDALHPERKTLRHRIILGAVVPVLTAVAVVVGWPIVVGLKLKELLTRWSRGRVSGAEGFVVREADLERSFTIAEIEKRERVVDPMGAVPDLPFGHLNSAWRRFVELEGTTGATVWSFSMRCKSAAGREEWCRGYVWVRPRSRGPAFVAGRSSSEA